MAHQEAAGVALTPDGIHVSPHDTRKYKFLTLGNGLQALVVSDPVTESASAAMDVRVGYHCDPDEIPGLAHFCEHMLFLGTEKYPDENSYSSFLSAHGGASNAFTAARDTNYYFDVSAPHLREALDRFAQFFLTPLFTASATEREMSAVDSENTNYLQDDYWRINQAHRSLGNHAHPFHKYGVGNLETLSTTPTAKQIDVRQALLTYYDEYYSANMMKLVVYGKEDVETLSGWVHELFANVRNTEREKPSFAQHPPFLSEQLGRRLEVVPVKDLKIVGVTWVLPPVRGTRYTQLHTSMLAHLIGHEGQGSLLSLLKQQKWAYGVSAGIEEDHDEFSMFLINFEMTELGIEHVDDVLLALFQYLHLLMQAPLPEWMFDEMQSLAMMHFLFQSKQPPINYTSAIAGTMQSQPKRDILSYGVLLYPYEPDQVLELVKMMTPSTMRLLVVCKSVEPTATSEEKWYGTKYLDSPLSAELVAKWSTPGQNELLALPEPNEFISSDFSLINKDQVPLRKYPFMVRDDETCRVWYKADVHFKNPKTHAGLTFFSPHVNNSPYAYVLSDLFVMCVQDELTEYSYDASLAGMHYDLAISGNTIHLGAVGYSAKLPVLVHRVVQLMSKFADHVKEETFERVKQAAIRSYENARLEEAYRHAMSETAFFLSENSWRYEELVQAISNCSFTMLRSHSKRLFQHVFLEAFLYGNVQVSQTLALVDSVLGEIQTSTSLPVLKSQRRWGNRQINLPEGVECVYRRPDPNPENMNCALDSVYQIGQENLVDRVRLAVFSQLVNEPFFNQLRTKEQLGYTVFSTPSRAGGVQMFRVIIQSNVASPEYIEQRVDAFWTEMRTMIEDMDPIHFQKQLQAVVKEYSEKPKNQEEEVQLLMNEITLQEYVFDRKEELARLVATVQLADVLAFFDTYICPQSPLRKKLSVRIYGKTMAFEPLQPSNSWARFNLASQTAILASMSLGGETFGPTSTTKTIEDAREFKRRADFYGLPVVSDPAQSGST